MQIPISTNHPVLYRLAGGFSPEQLQDAVRHVILCEGYVSVFGSGLLASLGLRDNLVYGMMICEMGLGSLIVKIVQSSQVKEKVAIMLTCYK